MSAKTSSTGTRTGGPLVGMRVVDVGMLIAAPFTAALLGDLGAEVLKVEHPRGDPLRQLEPSKEGIPLWWKVNARNKKCITLNLSQPKGAELFKRLLREGGIDVVVENFRPGTLERWGLSYGELAKANPGLVLLRISGFGQYGPYKNRPGFGRIAEAMSGLTYITGYPDRPPVHAGFPLADAIAGLYGAFSVLAALRHREATGEGQEIDLALYEGVFRLLEFHYIAYDQLGQIYERCGNRHPYVAPSDTYRTKDGRWVSLTASTPSIWERLARAMGREDLLQDPRFRDNRARVRHSDVVNGLVADWIGQHTLEELTRIFEEHQVAFGPVMNMADIAQDPHYRERGSVIELEDPELGRVRMPGVVPQFSRTPGRVRWAGPRLGEHNEEIYCGLLGLSPEELQTLREEGVI